MRTRVVECVVDKVTGELFEADPWTVACVLCWAPMGKPCVSQRGNRLSPEYSHPVRKQLAVALHKSDSAEGSSDA